MVGGRLKEDTNTPDAQDRADLRSAYERGRADERASRKRHPVLMTFTVIAAIVGAVLLTLAVVNGSFTRAGGVVDQNLNVAANKAEPVVRDAASDAGDTLRDAGNQVRDKANDTAG